MGLLSLLFLRSSIYVYQFINQVHLNIDYDDEDDEEEEEDEDDDDIGKSCNMSHLISSHRTASHIILYQIISSPQSRHHHRIWKQTRPNVPTTKPFFQEAGTHGLCHRSAPARKIGGSCRQQWPRGIVLGPGANRAHWKTWHLRRSKRRRHLYHGWRRLAVHLHLGLSQSLPGNMGQFTRKISPYREMIFFRKAGI